MTHTIRPARLVAAFALLGASIAIAATTSAPWWLIPALLLAPDLSFLAAIGAPATSDTEMPRRAVFAYNLVHHPSGPLVTLGLASATGSWTIALVATIWASHLTGDRALGYNLRSADGTIRDDRSTRRDRVPAARLTDCPPTPAR